MEGKLKGLRPFSSQLGQPFLLGKEKASFGPEPEAISHGAALPKERDHRHAWAPSPAEGGSQALPVMGVIPQSGMPC